jgi:hypothetical protein
LKVISSSAPRCAPAGEIEANWGAVAHTVVTAQDATQKRNFPQKPALLLKHVTNSDDAEPKLNHKKLKEDDR